MQKEARAQTRRLSRTSRYKTVYFALIGGGSLLFVWAILQFQLPPLAFLGLVLVLLLPGRILGYFWRDLLRGLRLLRAGEWAESKRHSELFLQQYARRPWIQHLIWLGWGTYSRGPEALALSNLGAAEIKLGDFAAARRHLEASIAVDAENPLPFVNMAALLRVMGKPEEATAWLEKAAERGYTRGFTDKIIASSQSRFAATDGSGQAPP